MKRLLLFLTCVLTLFGAGKAEEYKLITSTSDLVDGANYIIVASNANYALGTNQASNNRTGAAITKTTSGGISTITPGNDVAIIKLEDQQDGNYALRVTNGSSTGYLYAASSSGNQLKTQSSVNGNAKAKITFSGNNASIVFQGSNTNNNLQYNPNNGNPLFACYSTTQTAVQLYKEVTNQLGEISCTVSDGQNLTNGGEITVKKGTTFTFTADNATEYEIVVENGDENNVIYGDNYLSWTPTIVGENIDVYISAIDDNEGETEFEFTVTVTEDSQTTDPDPVDPTPGGEELSYTIKFKTADDNNGNTLFSKTSVPANVLEEGSDYVQGFTEATNAYINGVGGARIGTNKNDGSLSFDLSEIGQVVPTKIICLIAGNNNVTMSINGNSYPATKLNEDKSNYVECDLRVSNNEVLKSFTITKTGSNIGYIKSITVYYKETTEPEGPVDYEAPFDGQTYSVVLGGESFEIPVGDSYPDEITFTPNVEDVINITETYPYEITVLADYDGEITVDASWKEDENFTDGEASFKVIVVDPNKIGTVVATIGDEELENGGEKAVKAGTQIKFECLNAESLTILINDEEKKVENPYTLTINEPMEVIVYGSKGEEESEHFSYNFTIKKVRTFAMIKSADDLEEDAHYVLASKSDNKAVSTALVSNNKMNASPVDINSENVIEATDDILIVQLQKQNGDWGLYTTNYEGTNGYISLTDNGTNMNVSSSFSVVVIEIENSGDAKINRPGTTNDTRGIRINGNLVGHYADPNGNFVQLYKEEKEPEDFVPEFEALADMNPGDTQEIKLKNSKYPVITYFINENEDVISINDNEITALKIGQATITASWNADKNWLGGSTTLSVNVVKPELGVISGTYGNVSIEDGESYAVDNNTTFTFTSKNATEISLSVNGESQKSEEGSQLEWTVEELLKNAEITVTATDGESTNSLRFTLNVRNRVEASYTITFSGTDGEDSSLKLTDNKLKPDHVAEGVPYIDFDNFSMNDYVYNGKKDFGLKLGSANNKGQFTLGLSELGKVIPTKIVLVCANWISESTGKVDPPATFNVNGVEHPIGTETDELVGLEFEYNAEDPIESISVEVTGGTRAYVRGIEVYYMVEPVTLKWNFVADDAVELAHGDKHETTYSPDGGSHVYQLVMLNSDGEEVAIEETELESLVTTEVSGTLFDTPEDNTNIEGKYELTQPSNNVVINYAGTYNISANFVGSPIYAPATAAITAEVAPIEVTVTIPEQQVWSNAAEGNVIPSLIAYSNTTEDVTQYLTITVTPKFETQQKPDKWSKSCGIDQGLWNQMVAIAKENRVDAYYGSADPTATLAKGNGTDTSIEYDAKIPFDCSGVYEITVSCNDSSVIFKETADDEDPDADDVTGTISIYPSTALSYTYTDAAGKEISGGLSLNSSAIDPDHGYVNLSDSADLSNVILYIPGTYLADIWYWVQDTNEDKKDGDGEVLNPGSGDSSSDVSGDEDAPMLISKRRASVLSDSELTEMGYVKSEDNVIDLSKLSENQVNLNLILVKNGAITPLSATGNNESESRILINLDNNAETGIEGIGEEDGEAVYYNLQGVRVQNPEHGIYVKVQNGKATKVLR